MLDRILEICKPEQGGNFIDCTFGSGGYSNAILSFPKTKVLALDRDMHTEEHLNETKNQTPWQEIYRNTVGQLSGGGIIELAEKYKKIRHTIPRHSH